MIGQIGILADARKARVERRPVICWPWTLRGGEPDGLHPIGAECERCRCDVAQPRSLADREPFCLYCALDIGLLPLVEVPPEVSQDGTINLRFESFD